MIAAFFTRLYQKLADLNGARQGQAGEGRTGILMIRIAFLTKNRLQAAPKLLLGAMLAVALLAGAGCSTDNTEEQEAAEYPNLNTVPEKPETVASLAEADKIGEGLRADRDKARYTDENLRADTSVQPPLAPPPAPEPAASETETVTETVTETATEATETIQETVEETTEPVVAAVPQEPVQQENLTPPAEGAEPKEQAPSEAAPDRESTQEETTTVISSEGVRETTVAGIYEQQLAASAASRLPDGMSAEASAGGNSGSDPAPSRDEAPRLSPPSEDGGRVIPNYAAASGTTPVETLYFSQGSSRLGAADRTKLDRIARAQKAADSTIRIVGHASSRTREMPEERHMMVNFGVSQARAAAVAEYFLNAGITADSLIVESVSDSEPVATEPMPSAEARNRRVEIFILN